MSVKLYKMKLTNTDGTVKFPENWSQENKNDFYSIQFWQMYYYYHQERKVEYSDIKKKFIAKNGIEMTKEMENLINRSKDWYQFWSDKGVDYAITR